MTQRKGWVVKIDESSVKYKGELCIRGGLRDRKLSTDAFMRFAEEGKVRFIERGREGGNKSCFCFRIWL